MKAIATGDCRWRKASVSPVRFHFLSGAPKAHAVGMNPGQRSLLFREVNDRMYELLATADPDLPVEFLCECGQDCGRRVELLPAEFATLRETGEVVRSPGCRELTLPRRRREAVDGVPALTQ
jgi:hypothetical protein